MDDRKSAKSVEQTIKNNEQIIGNAENLEYLDKCLDKASEGIQFQKVKLTFFQENRRLGSPLDKENHSVGKVVSWSDYEQSGYFSRDKEFVAEFQISGRNYSYGKIRYVFMDGRNSLSVQDEVLLERVHDGLAILAGRLRKTEYKL
jgi:hypothetical protein